jgi:hypothetical protein
MFNFFDISSIKKCLLTSTKFNIFTEKQKNILKQTTYNLRYCCINGYIDAVNILLKSDLDDNYWCIGFDMAVINKHKEIAKLIYYNKIISLKNK